MLERATVGYRLRKALRNWLEQSAHLRSDFGACGPDCEVHPGAYIPDPGTVTLGTRSVIYRGCTVLTGPGTFTLGSDSHLSGFVYVNALRAGVHIGSGVIVGPYCILLSYSNAVVPGRTITESRTSADVFVGNDVFVGGGVIVVPGVRIGDGAVVGAGSVVNRNVEPYTIVAGIPARVIRERER
jgi:acetyltransferase-like isoleucine patch superfamily enzyme